MTYINFDEFLPGKQNSDPSFLSFSYCAVPFLYLNDGKKGVEIVYTNMETVYVDSYQLSRLQSREIFNRNATILKVIVHFEQKK